MGPRQQMNLPLIVLMLLLVCVRPCSAAGSSSAKPAHYPKLVSGTKIPDCAVALKVANLAFKSKATFIYEAAKEISSKDASIVLWPTNDSIVLGPPDHESFASNPSYMECKACSGQSKSICLQKQSINGVRLAVLQKQMNWKGDMFDTMVVKSEDDQDQVRGMLAQFNPSEGNLPSGVHIIGKDNWQQPWILRNSSNEHLMLVDPQHPADFFADWLVYKPDKTGSATCICKIAFKPKSDNAFKLIPQGPLRELALLLDDIIGHPNPDTEGTMRQTDRLRTYVQNMWGNVLYRPQALIEPSSNRLKVEQGLKRWATGSRVYQQQYARLHELYPKALQQLTQYEEQFTHLSHVKAASQAAKYLDIAYRSNFQF